jgi:nucleoid-associated protein YgaU
MLCVPKCIGTALLISIPLLAQKARRAEFEKQLSALQLQEQSFREQIALEQTAILDLKTQLEASRNRIAATRQKKLAFLGISESDLVEYSNKAQRLDKDLNRLLNCTESELLSDTVLFQTYVQQAEHLRKSPVFRLRSCKPVLTGIVQNISALEQRYSSLQDNSEQEKPATAEVSYASAPPTYPDNQNTYTVTNENGKPETLFSIAAKVYGDPYKWDVIYRANKSVLDKNFNRFQKSAALKTIAEPSDLIFPGQVLAIPR